MNQVTQDIRATKPTLLNALFVSGFNAVAEHHHEIMVAKGFWDGERNFSESLMLIVTEIAETCEAERDGNPPDDKLPEFSSVEVELSDAILRIMDLAQGRGLNVAEALIAKLEYNRTRAYRHGKEF